MAEKRLATAEEAVRLEPLFQQKGINHPKEIRRLIDTKLGKEYNVYTVETEEQILLIKKTDIRWNEKPIYDRYFSGFKFPVPRIYDRIDIGGEVYLFMDYVEAEDARGCGVEEAARIGEALGTIQCSYLTEGGHREEAEKYFAKHRKYYERLAEHIPAGVWRLAEKRYYEAPQTLIHDDLLPINVLLGSGQPWIIDWETAGMRPYFLDLARFAFVINPQNENEWYIDKAAGDSFLQAYYDVMRKNPEFYISREQYKTDVAISALWQYIMFINMDGDFKKTKAYEILMKIVEYLNDNSR